MTILGRKNGSVRRILRRSSYGLASWQTTVAGAGGRSRPGSELPYQWRFMAADAPRKNDHAYDGCCNKSPVNFRHVAPITLPAYNEKPTGSAFPIEVWQPRASMA
jgi:hypothetical protein